MLICVSCIGVTKDFSVLITNLIPNLHFNGDSQCFPRYYYEGLKRRNSLLAPKETVGGFTRQDAITDFILKESQAKYGQNVTKDDIFYYVYGLLHSEDYRIAFSADLKKSLPRLPLVDAPDDFRAFSNAGRDLAELHLNYEAAPPCPKAVVTGEERGDFAVAKMRFADTGDKSAIQYNHAIRISGIPLEAYRYVVNGRSAIDWLMDRYQVRIDKDSGIKNDPNDWGQERGNPRYILDLLLSVITVSLETMKIVDSLPRLDFSEAESS